MADAFVKNIQGIDWTSSYAAMKKNAEVQPPYWYDSFAPDASTKQGRGALPDWLKYGYITRNYTRSVSRTLEYAYDDFALSQVAAGLNNEEDHNKYLQRGSNWRNIWNKDATASSTAKYSYKGFVQPRNADGSFNFTHYDPFSCFGCYWGDDEYEGKPVEYGFAVPHDIKGLIELIGDNQTFITRINDLYPLHGEKIADVGNEPSFLTPFLFNFVQEQWRTVELTRYIMQKDFAKNLPGNSDGGALQGWMIFNMLGFYPIAGTTTYLISSPFFSSLKLQLENGATFEIRAPNLSDENIYVQSLKINGQEWNKNWVDHQTLFGAQGGLIEFDLGADQVVWETGEVPPSPGYISF